eukprot:555805-Hanusia_phi.AAC.2
MFFHHRVLSLFCSQALPLIQSGHYTGVELAVAAQLLPSWLHGSIAGPSIAGPRRPYVVR